ncbi:DUF6786 family protein [Maribellus comscasis]|uniref:DUF6786 family protein n=1 Tax=Maribellus comscasis TaxID=2681766 RepID=UPI001C2D018A|nr:DUF6786 family protein [Maribellus comscasis]
MKIFSLIIIVVFFLGCSNAGKKTDTSVEMQNFEKGSYGYDLETLQKNEKPIELINKNARILLSAKYQGRVMTSTSAGKSGKSYGWINHDLISSGEVLKQFNPVGGEERFWLGPEGGQFSIFFPAGKGFDFEDWNTPASIDTETYDIVEANEKEAVFSKSIELVNYSDFHFQLEVNRKIEILENPVLEDELSVSIPADAKCVGYQTVNTVKNTGDKAWEKETGLLSIWLLGMFNPSPSVTIFIPYKTDVESDYIVKDDYFGKIPEDRLKVRDGMIFFRGDGKERGKIGIPPQRALPYLGSYDTENKVLTIVKTNIPEAAVDYVNSAWELQDFPFKGDAINAYNDGPLEDESQLGPFYELESSSPALALQSGERAAHTQLTVHFEGEEEDLNGICRQVFGITVSEIKNAF